jgi:hypothetical protein
MDGFDWSPLEKKRVLSCGESVRRERVRRAEVSA